MATIYRATKELSIEFVSPLHPRAFTTEVVRAGDELTFEQIVVLSGSFVDADGQPREFLDDNDNVIEPDDDLAAEIAAGLGGIRSQLDALIDAGHLTAETE